MSVDATIVSLHWRHTKPTSNADSAKAGRDPTLTTYMPVLRLEPSTDVSSITHLYDQLSKTGAPPLSRKFMTVPPGISSAQANTTFAIKCRVETTSNGASTGNRSKYNNSTQDVSVTVASVHLHVDPLIIDRVAEYTKIMGKEALKKVVDDVANASHGYAYISSSLRALGYFNNILRLVFAIRWVKSWKIWRGMEIIW